MRSKHRIGCWSASAASIEVVLTEGFDAPVLAGRAITRFSSLHEHEPGAEEAVAHSQVEPDSIAKFLFTSGSTKLPKAVINTQRMICTSQQQILQCFQFMLDEPPVLIFAFLHG